MCRFGLRLTVKLQRVILPEHIIIHVLVAGAEPEEVLDSGVVLVRALEHLESVVFGAGGILLAPLRLGERLCELLIAHVGYALGKEQGGIDSS